MDDAEHYDERDTVIDPEGGLAMIDDEDEFEEMMELMMEISSGMLEKLNDRKVQLRGIQAYVSLLTAVPSVTLVKKKKVLKKTQGIKRVLRAMMSHPHFKLLIYEGLVFIAHTACLSRQLKEMLLSNGAMKICAKSTVEWYKQFVIVTAGLSATFQLMADSAIGLSKAENLQGLQVLLCQLLRHYGQETSGERSNDVLEGIFEITALFRNKRVKYEDLLKLCLDWLGHFNSSSNNSNYRVFNKCLNAVGNLTYSHAMNRELAVRKGILQIVTSALHNQYNIETCVSSMIVLNNLSQSQNILIESLLIGDGERLLALVIETIKISHFVMNSAALNLISNLCLNDRLRQMCLDRGLMDLLESDVMSKRFQGRHNRRYKKFEERRKRCIDVLTIKSTEEKQLIQAELQVERETQQQLYYREEYTGRRMRIGLTGKLSPKDKKSESNGVVE